MMKTTIQLLAISALSCQGAVVWNPAPNALASASWDTWTYAPLLGETGTGSQGGAQATTGGLITSSDLVTAVRDSYDSPGGLGGNPDTYYFHTGGGDWTGSLVLTEGVTFVRVSYSLLGFNGGSAEAYAMPPSIAGASEIGSGQYATNDGAIIGTVFFRDFELASGQTEVETTFGDVIFQGFPGSFRSVDGVQLEVFSEVPIPEPSSLLLSGVASLALLKRRRG